MGLPAITPAASVTVGGRPYQIRFSNGAFYLLSTWGIDATSLLQTINASFRANQYTATMYKLAAAALGTTDADGNWRTAGITPLEMADRLRDGEVEVLLDVVWKEFTGKLGLETKTAAPDPAPTMPAANATNGTGGASGPSPLHE